jgi:hypothetical protein
MKRSVPYKQEKSVPYHGAVPVAIGVRKLIAETPVGARRLMSAGLMVELLQEEGLPEAMANRLFSQVRLTTQYRGVFLTHFALRARFLLRFHSRAFQRGSQN